MLDFSPYSQIENKMSEAVKQVTENTIHPSDVAKAILEAVTSNTPDFRYVVGKDGTMRQEKICLIENFKT
jgi:hypothetical protein